MNTYEVGKEIRLLEEKIDQLPGNRLAIQKANPGKNANLALRKLQRIRNLHNHCKWLEGETRRLLVHSTIAQAGWLGELADKAYTVQVTLDEMREEERRIIQEKGE